MKEVRLSRAQLDAWRTFGPAWTDFKEAWLGRGFLFPPDGDPDDDYGTSLRSRLWVMVDARPSDTARWIRMAPGRTRREVVAYLFGQWSAIQDAAPDDEDLAEQRAKRRERSQAPQAIGAIMRGLL